MSTKMQRESSCDFSEGFEVSRTSSTSLTGFNFPLRSTQDNMIRRSGSTSFRRCESYDGTPTNNFIRSGKSFGNSNRKPADNHLRIECETMYGELLNLEKENGTLSELLQSRDKAIASLEEEKRVLESELNHLNGQVVQIRSEMKYTKLTVQQLRKKGQTIEEMNGELEQQLKTAKEALEFYHNEAAIEKSKSQTLEQTLGASITEAARLKDHAAQQQKQSGALRGHVLLLQAEKSQNLELLHEMKEQARGYTGDTSARSSLPCTPNEGCRRRALSVCVDPKRPPLEMTASDEVLLSTPLDVTPMLSPNFRFPTLAEELQEATSMHPRLRRRISGMVVEPFSHLLTSESSPFSVRKICLAAMKSDSNHSDDSSSNSSGSSDTLDSCSDSDDEFGPKVPEDNTTRSSTSSTSLGRTLDLPRITVTSEPQDIEESRFGVEPARLSVEVQTETAATVHVAVGNDFAKSHDTHAMETRGASKSTKIDKKAVDAMKKSCMELQTKSSKMIKTVPEMCKQETDDLPSQLVSREGEHKTIVESLKQKIQTLETIATNNDGCIPKLQGLMEEHQLLSRSVADMKAEHLLAKEAILQHVAKEQSTVVRRTKEVEDLNKKLAAQIKLVDSYKLQIKTLKSSNNNMEQLGSKIMHKLKGTPTRSGGALSQMSATPPPAASATSLRPPKSPTPWPLGSPAERRTSLLSCTDNRPMLEGNIHEGSQPLALRTWSCRSVASSTASFVRLPRPPASPSATLNSSPHHRAAATLSALGVSTLIPNVDQMSASASNLCWELTSILKCSSVDVTPKASSCLMRFPALSHDFGGASLLGRATTPPVTTDYIEI